MKNIFLLFIFIPSIAFGQPASESKLDFLFHSRNIGNSLQLLEKTIGEPVRIDKETHDYIVDGCGVSIVSNEDVVNSILLKLTPTCQVNLGNFKSRLDIMKYTNDVTFSDLAGKADFAAILINGTCCFSTIAAVNQGSNAVGYYSIALFQTIYDTSQPSINDSIELALDKFYKKYPTCKLNSYDGEIPNETCGEFSGIKNPTKRELTQIEFNKGALEAFEGVKFGYIMLSNSAIEYNDFALSIHHFDFLE